MIGRKRACALMLCACVALGLLFPTLYAVLAVGHACCGCSCKVCEALVKTEALLRAFALFALALTSCWAILNGTRAAFAAAGQNRIGDGTPVGRKVRLND